MVFSKEQMDRAVKVYTANPYWKECYDGATSDACRERIILIFCYSINFDEVEEEEFKHCAAEVESRLTSEDWKHLAKYAGNNPWGAKCRANAKRLEEAGR